MADHELVRETMVSLGEGMEDCGYNAVLETVEGNGIVGRAVRNPRDSDQLRIIVLYLKDLAKTIKAEPPTPERQQAMQLLQEAWETIRAAVFEEEDEAMVKTRKETSPLPVPRPRLPDPMRPGTPMTRPGMSPGARQPSIARPQQIAKNRSQQVVVAPMPKQQRPIQGSAGNHYFRSR